MEVSSNGINRKRLIRTHLHELNGWNQLEAIDSDDPDKNKVGSIIKWNRLEAIDSDESSIWKDGKRIAMRPRLASPVRRWGA